MKIRWISVNVALLNFFSGTILTEIPVYVHWISEILSDSNLD